MNLRKFLSLFIITQACDESDEQNNLKFIIQDNKFRKLREKDREQKAPSRWWH